MEQSALASLCLPPLHRSTNPYLVRTGKMALGLTIMAFVALVLHVTGLFGTIGSPFWIAAGLSTIVLAIPFAVHRAVNAASNRRIERLAIEASAFAAIDEEWSLLLAREYLAIADAYARTTLLLEEYDIARVLSQIIDYSSRVIETYNADPNSDDHQNARLIIRKLTDEARSLLPETAFMSQEPTEIAISDALDEVAHLFDRTGDPLLQQLRDALGVLQGEQSRPGSRSATVVRLSRHLLPRVIGLARDYAGSLETPARRKDPDRTLRDAIDTSVDALLSATANISLAGSNPSSGHRGSASAAHRA